VSVSHLGAKTHLTGYQPAAGSSVEAAGEPDDNPFAVLSDHQGPSFLDQSDLLGPEDRNVFSGRRRVTVGEEHLSGWQLSQPRPIASIAAFAGAR
jgi:hypothetical protein